MWAGGGPAEEEWWIKVALPASGRLGSCVGEGESGHHSSPVIKSREEKERRREKRTVEGEAVGEGEEAFCTSPSATLRAKGKGRRVNWRRRGGGRRGGGLLHFSICDSACEGEGAKGELVKRRKDEGGAFWAGVQG
ncbi:unnamed protein product [Linum trigynum]|uniref:Uncharacterized protein n=1 Tax=Linum trigynum TaxID=586398 RepID=A0AAV2EB92_9ROSI